MVNSAESLQIALFTVDLSSSSTPPLAVMMITRHVVEGSDPAHASSLATPALPSTCHSTEFRQARKMSADKRNAVILTEAKRNMRSERNRQNDAQ